MNGKRLLDTNIIVAFLTEDQQVQERLDAVPELLVPMVVMGELYYGAAHSERPQQNVAMIETFARSCVLLGIDVENSEYRRESRQGASSAAGAARARLRRGGRCCHPTRCAGCRRARR